MKKLGVDHFKSQFEGLSKSELTKEFTELGYEKIMRYPNSWKRIMTTNPKAVAIRELINEKCDE